uniref:Apple domain-containing protein n=1 Tax=viral metagenome TaxID=1070528 RepID=A0A6C0KM78_9ZZZZ
MDDYNKIKNENMDKSLLKIEVLQKEYEVTLQEYQEAVQNYINSLETNSPSFSALQGRTWWGSAGLKESTVSSQDECIDMCASNDKCSGATFNPVKRYCWTRSGEGKISTGLENDYALITKQTEYMSIMKYLNNKLLDLNKKIANGLTIINPQIKQQIEEKNNKQQLLNETYQKLLDQKKKMENESNQYESINKNNTNQSLYTNNQNISMRFWVLITFIVLFFTINRLFNRPSPSIGYLFWLFIILGFLILTFNLTTAGGFLICFSVLIAIILMKTGFLPSL